MLTTVFNHNNAQPDNNTCIAVIDFTGSGSNIPRNNSLSSSPNKVSQGSRYKVVFKYDSKTKLLTTITITAKK